MLEGDVRDFDGALQNELDQNRNLLGESLELPTGKLRAFRLAEEHAADAFTLRFRLEKARPEFVRFDDEVPSDPRSSCLGVARALVQTAQRRQKPRVAFLCDLVGALNDELRHVA